MARPKMITKEVMQRVCDELADGKSLNQICRMDDMPSRRAIYYSIQRDDDMHELYARSRALIRRRGWQRFKDEGFLWTH